MQSTDATVVQWIEFVRKLPPDNPEKPLSQESLVESIVKIYHRRTVRVHQFGHHDICSDTIFEAICDHYSAQRCAIPNPGSSTCPLKRNLVSSVRCY